MKTPESVRLGKNIQKIRRARGISTIKLAELLYVSESTIHNWEQGRHRTHLSLLEKLAEVLGVSLDELMGTDDEH